MIIRIIATALIQCTVRTQAGWMTFPVAGTVRSSLAARLDMAIPLAVPSLDRVGTGLYAGTRRSVTVLAAIRLIPGVYWRSQKSEPGRPGSPLTHPGGDQIGMRLVLRRRHQHSVDHMDHAVGLIDVRDRHHRGTALGVDDPDLAVLVLDRQLFAFSGLELLAVGQAGGFELARNHVIGQDFG